jgi:hypothetical protein
MRGRAADQYHARPISGGAHLPRYSVYLHPNLGLTDQLVFSARPSEIASTNSGDVYVGIIVEAEAGSSVLRA